MAERGSGFEVAVVGASAGGVEALLALAGELRVDFPAALFVVLHVPPTGISVLPQLLTRGGPLPAQHATDGARIEGGRIYCAPPDCHLLLGEGTMRVNRGPRENGYRPGIDPLFRTAAHAYGTAAAGAILSGTLDDGAAGLRAIGLAGGATFAQDPGEALYGAMPMNAIQLRTPDAVLPVRELARRLNELARSPRAAASVAAPPPDRAEIRRSGTREDQWSSPRSAYGCPSCGGALWEVAETGGGHFRCRVGHSFTFSGLLNAQTDGLETALWSALRALEERIALTRRVGERLREQKLGSAERFELQAEDAEAQATLLRDLLENLDVLNHVAPSAELEPEPV